MITTPKGSSPKLLGHRVMRQALADSLRAKIVLGQLAPGTHLVEDVISKEYEVSKTPVREALMSLARTGLVEMKPHYGAYVVKITPRLVEEVSTLRLELEVFAARLAMSKLSLDDFTTMKELAQQMEEAVAAGNLPVALDSDTAFHETIIRGSDHHLLFETWQALSHRVELIQAYGRLYAPTPERGHVTKSHNRIVDALRTRDVDAVRAQLAEHVQFGSALVLADLAKMPVDADGD